MNLFVLINYQSTIKKLNLKIIITVLQIFENFEEGTKSVAKHWIILVPFTVISTPNVNKTLKSNNNKAKMSAIDKIMALFGVKCILFQLLIFTKRYLSNEMITWIKED